jgi:hypothetical protein
MRHSHSANRTGVASDPRMGRRREDSQFYFYVRVAFPELGA